MRWSTGGIDSLERQDERGQIARRLDGITQTVECCHLTMDPAHNAPRIRKHFFGIARCNGNRHREWEMAREDRQPLLLLGDVLDRPVNPRKPNRELVAEAIHGVVGASGPDPFNRKIRPLRMLRNEQTTHQLAIGFDLVVVHLRL